MTKGYKRVKQGFRRKSLDIYRRSKADNEQLDAVTERLKAICENGG